MKNLYFVLVILVLSCSLKHDYSGWIGSYQYEEEPVKALAGYSMSMVWDIEVQKTENDFIAKIAINGQQTYMIIQAKLLGDDNMIKFIFDRGLDGFGFEDFKTGDNLFELTKKDSKLLTRWNKLTPRLLEEFENNKICFRLKE